MLTKSIIEIRGEQNFSFSRENEIIEAICIERKAEVHFSVINIFLRAVRVSS
jgi:hypothetical protein